MRNPTQHIHAVWQWIFTAILLLMSVKAFGAVDASAPDTPVKLVFIHHSTGGNWLADSNADQPYGGLGAALAAANYYVSATNYGWGPDGIGDRTDIVNWPEWFTGSGSAAVMNALSNEFNQNFGGFGTWSRSVSDPGGENEIIMFKSCFPNSNLFGNPTDPAAETPNDQLTVENAKAVYNTILSYFQTRQDKLFVVVTAPPLMASEYTADYQTAAQRAANARAFNNWLVNDWLDAYPYDNVGVFDYFNVLTGPDNHHRISNGAIEHTTVGDNNYAYYPSGDSHPSTSGQQKATAEFVDLLNCYYHRWQTAGSASDDAGGDTGTGDASDGSDSGDAGEATTGRIMPVDLIYRGAFRLPGGDDGGWHYSGGGLTYFPQGDPSGPDDGYPGSLFGAGYNVENRISEISIPAPVISASKNVSDLNTAGTLQPFTDLKGSMSALLDTPPQYMGITWLPPQGTQISGKLYLSYGQHFQDFYVSHEWCETTLSSPDIAGPWYFGNYTNYVTNDYLLGIPASFANQYLNGRQLGSGRHREGVWGGRGPALFAAAPWSEGNPPAANTTLSAITPLLLYGEPQSGTPEILTDSSREMLNYSEADYWSGAAWLAAGDNGAVVFIGTKALGNSWYGFANGVQWPYDCAETNSCPDVPDWPNDDRGYWADDYEARLAFYDPADLASVATGAMETWEPQPYATLSLTQYLFDTEMDVTRYRRHLVGAAAYDETHHMLYFFELLADSDKSLIHVFEVNSSDDGGSGTGGAGDDGTGSDDSGVDDGTDTDDSGTGTGTDDGTSTGGNETDSGDGGNDTATVTPPDSGSSGGNCFISRLL